MKSKYSRDLKITRINQSTVINSIMIEIRIVGLLSSCSFYLCALTFESVSFFFVSDSRDS